MVLICDIDRRNDTMQVTRTSKITGKIHTLELDITQAQIDDYKAGALVQNAFPNLPGELSEFFISGITPEEWIETFSNMDD
jgi:hypothetical protein